jgi:hypothetical protein
MIKLLSETCMLDFELSEDSAQDTGLMCWLILERMAALETTNLSKAKLQADARKDKVD